MDSHRLAPVVAPGTNRARFAAFPRSTQMNAPLTTPDGRYIVVDGILWRASDPRLPADRRQALVDELMAARRAVGQARSDADRRAARTRVQAAKVALGERGPVWWDDGAPDLTRRKAANTPYADWYEETTCES